MPKEDGQWKKGDTPHNKGLKLIEYCTDEVIEKIKQTQFTPDNFGEKHGSWKGGVQHCKKDCVHLNVGSNQRIRRPKHIYEQKYGKVRPNWLIYHLDGDRENDKIENLIAIPRAIMLMLNRKHQPLGGTRKEIEEAVRIYLEKQIK